MSIAVIYASKTGNTKAVAEYIARKTEGKAIDISAAKKEDIESNDTIVFGSKVWAGKIDKKIAAFIEENKSSIESKRTALFVCCMYNDDKGAKQCDAIADSLGIKNHTFFNKGKKLVESGEEIDDFISSF